VGILPRGFSGIEKKKEGYVKIEAVYKGVYSLHTAPILIVLIGRYTRLYARLDYKAQRLRGDRVQLLVLQDQADTEEVSENCDHAIFANAFGPIG